jgi:hypothetical protein
VEMKKGYHTNFDYIVDNRETTPIGRELEEVNLSSKFFDFISQNLAAT